MKRIDLTECPVCGGSAFTDYTECQDHYATGEQYKIGSCRQCGFRFTRNFPDETEIGRYYETADYVSHSDTRKGLMNKIYHLVRSLMLQRKGKLTCEASGMEKGSLLDIGCGTGYYLHTMQQLGWKVQGVEKNQGAAQAARSHFNLSVRSDLQEVEKTSFDVITLWHVLEHLQNLSSVFATLRSLLKEEGTLIIALPNSDSYDAKLYGAFWGAYDVPRHLWHFTPDTFARLASKEGFVIEKFAPMPFDAFYVSMLSEKYRGNRFPFLRGVISGTQALFSSLSDPKKSSSIIYLLRKKK